MSSHADTPRAPNAAPLFSRQAQDPAMKELVEFFLDDLTPRSASLQLALDNADLTLLRHLANQLKCAAVNYGFPEITDLAAAVELHAQNPHPDVFNLTVKVHDLLALCNRAIASR